MVKIFIDPGHGGRDPGATAGSLKEKDITLSIAKNIRKIIQTNGLKVSLKMSRTDDSTVSLAKRIQSANDWQADLFLSIHVNAGGGTGYEDYIHTSLSNQSKTAQIRNIIHKEISKYHTLRNRGKKKANFQVLRETTMPAILTENGFIDHPEDQKLLQSNVWLKSLSEGYVNAMIKALHLSTSVQGPKNDEPVYRVITGSFTHKENAKTRVKQLKQSGYDSFIDQVTVNNKKLFRVVSGSFAKKENANRLKSRLQNAGFSSFLMPYKI